MPRPQYIEVLVLVEHKEVQDLCHQTGRTQSSHRCNPLGVFGYMLIPGIDPETAREVKRLFLPNVQMIRGTEECPEGLSKAILSGRLEIRYVLLCPSRFKLFEMHDDLSLGTCIIQLIDLHNCVPHRYPDLASGDLPRTTSNTLSVFNQNECLKFMYELVFLEANIRYGGACGSTFLHLAIHVKCKPLIQFLLHNGADPQARAQEDRTALHMAITSCSSIPILKLLIERGADINATASVRDVSGITPLLLALRQESCSLDVARFLLDNGAAVDASDSAGCSVTQEAARRSPEILSSILNRHPKLGDPKNRKVLRNVSLSHFVDLKNGVPDSDPHRMDNNRSIDQLLAYGFDIDSADAKDIEVLFGAIKSGSLELVTRLLENGASVTDVCLDMTALHVAAAYASESTIQVLLEYGGNINVKRLSGETTLTTAAEHGNVEALKCLLARGAVLQEHPHLLHAVVSRFRESSKTIETLRYLIGAGFDVNTGHRGNTPLMSACHNRLARSLEILIQHGAQFDNHSYHIQNYFLSAVVEGAVDFVIVLLKNGVDPELNVGEVFSQALRSRCALPVMSSLFLMLEYPRAKTAKHLILRDMVKFAQESSMGSRFIIDVLEYDLVSCEDIFEIKEIYEDIRSIKMRNDELFHHISALYAAGLNTNSDVNMAILEKELGLSIIFGASMEAEDCALMKEYASEVAAMKNKKIPESQITFYDVLEASIPRLVSFVRNESIVETLEKVENYEEFPSYFGMIWKRFRKAVFRKHLVNEGLNMFDHLFARSPSLSPELALKILDYLNNKQLLVLSGVCHLPSSEVFTHDLIALVNGSVKN